MEILIAAGHLPGSQGRQGGARSSYFLFEHLARRHRLYLLAFATQLELAEFDRKDMAIFASWDVSPVTDWHRVFGGLSAPALPLSIAARKSGAYRRKLRRLLATRHFDVVILDHEAMFQYAADVPSSSITVGNAHDILSQNWARRVSHAKSAASRLLIEKEYRRLENWERVMYEKLGLVVPHNEKDKELINRLTSNARVAVIDPWVTLPANDAHPPREEETLLFWGAMNRAENLDAARWTTDTILPVIQRHIPGARFYIAGNHSDTLASQFAGRTDIVTTGFVEDVTALMARMEIAFLPLRLGAGIKIKVLECMAAGLPVVTTSVGAEGIGGTHGIHYLVAENADELAAHAVHLLGNKADARRMGASAREFIARRYKFGARIDEMENLLESAIRIAGRPKEVGVIL